MASSLFKPRTPPDGDFAAYLTLLGVDFEVHEAPKLVEAITRPVERLNRAVHRLPQANPGLKT